MKRLLAAVLALLLAPLMARAEGWQTSTPEAEGMSSKELAGLVGFGIDHGMDSLLVTRHGKIVAEAYYAPFASGYRHRINSSTKSVIGSLVAIALRDGLIKSLDQPVLDFFPGREFANTDERKKAITLKHLLDMTSGLDWTEPLSDAPLVSMFEMERSRDWVQYVLDRPMAHEPGTTFNYNSGNPHLLSAVLSKVTGRSAEDYAKEKLFGPLGITDVLWRRDPQGVSTGGYGLYLQSRDMARLGTLWLADGMLGGKRVLPDGWIAEVRRAKVDMGLPSLRYANLFWSIPERDVFSAVGFDRQLIIVMPKFDIVAAFTGARRYSNAEGKPGAPNYRLGTVINSVQAAVKSDAALPEDSLALALLAERTKAAAVEARTEPAGALPAMAAAISGKVWRLQPNPVRLASISLTFENGKASYGYEIDGKSYGGPVGLDGLYGIGGKRLYGPSGAKGKWLDDGTFQLETQTIGGDDANIFTFTFDAKSASIKISSLLGFKADLKGEAEE
jgi:CubicO group peptidase (beta-lactamase class C family)